MNYLACGYKVDRWRNDKFTGFTCALPIGHEGQHSPYTKDAIDIVREIYERPAPGDGGTR